MSLSAVSKRHAEKLVLDGVTLGIDERDRVGVIGVNGSGKSTLLAIVAGALDPDAGSVVYASGARVRLLPQEPALEPATTALEVVLSGLPEEAAHEAEAILHRLGVTDPARPVGELSGGQRRRVDLARALAQPADLLVLDEPTNHLDVDIVDWLEDHLRQRTGALLMVTHDRYLLDRISTRIVEVEGGRLHTAHGSYGDYLEARAVREQQAAANERRRANRARTELAWLRRGAQARTTKAKYRVEAATALLEAAPPAEREGLMIELPPGRRLGGKVVNLHGAGVRYGERWVLRGVDRRIAPRDRLGVVGPNGSGKTTLLALIAGRLDPSAGSVATGETVVVGWYGQTPRELPPGQRVIDAVKDVTLETKLTSGVTVSASQLLERFTFSGQAQKALVGELSGGERRRLELLLVLAEAPNVLLLDEPTNDLDLDTLGVLEEYLDTWPGTLVVASHDRYFLDRVCDDLLSVEPEGSLRHHPGGWEAYRAHRAAQDRAAKATPADKGEERTRAERPRKASYGERRELTTLERRIPELEAKQAELADALAAAAADHVALQRLGAELGEVSAELEAAETRWLELSEIVEA